MKEVMILAAEEAYGVLTEKEQETMENAELLISAREEWNRLKADREHQDQEAVFAGRWVCEFDGDQEIHFSEDNTYLWYDRSRINMPHSSNCHSHNG